MKHRLFVLLLLTFTVIFTISQVGAQEDLFEIDPNDFDPATSINIDNEYLPFQPGTQLVYEGQAFDPDEEEFIERGIIYNVTDLVKDINGVHAVVVWITDFNDEELIESELAFFAQDNDGNVWYLGELVEIWDEDGLVGAHSWLPGLPEDAKAGIVMWNEPMITEETYSQGYAPEPVSWTDRARVAEISEEMCIELDCYENVLTIEESDQADPEAVQLKFYASGVGNIGVGFAGDDPEQEELELVELNQLDEDELAEVREEALALEERAYMYSQTAPAQQR